MGSYLIVSTPLEFHPRRLPPSALHKTYLLLGQELRDKWRGCPFRVRGDSPQLGLWRALRGAESVSAVGVSPSRAWAGLPWKQPPL